MWASFVAYLALMIGGGRYLGMDEIAFKAAGREWAQSGRFAAPELRGFLGLQPPVEDVWLAQPPVYTFGFGVLARAVGFGARVCVTWDAGIHVLLALLTFLLAGQLEPGLPRPVRAATALIVLPLGYWARADELGMCLAMIGFLLLLRSRTWSSAALSGVLYGLAAGTSVGPALGWGVWGTLLILRRDAVLRARLGTLASWVGGGALGLVAVLLPYLLLRPDALQQFLAHAARQAPGPYLPALASSWRYASGSLLLLGGFLATATVSLSARSQSLAEWGRRWAGPLAGQLLLHVLFPSKFTYLWLLGPALLIASVSVVDEAVRSRRWWVVGLCSVILAVGIVGKSRDFLLYAVQCWLLPAEQSLSWNAEQVRALIPPGRRVMASQYWWVLAGDHVVLDPEFAALPAQDLDFVVLTAGGSGAPGRPAGLREAYASHVAAEFDVVWDNLPRERVRILGVPLTNSSWGWGAMVLRRRASRER